MHPLRTLLSVALAATLSLSLTACADSAPAEGAAPAGLASAEGDTAPESASPAVVVDNDALPPDETPDTAAMDVPPEALAVAPPESSAVLDAIFGAPDDEAAAPGEVGRRLPDGRVATFWGSQVFALDGAGMYAAFAFVASPDASSPDDTVQLAQATWRFRDGAWQLESSARSIGRFGGQGRAPLLDGMQDARVHAGDGRVLLAMPTAEPANAGVVVYAFELLAGEGEPLAWRHVGRVPAGSDNGAGCSDVSGSPMPCASTAGTLDFIDVDAASGAAASDARSTWPTLRLALQGTVVTGPGEVRETTPDDVVEMRFDAASGQYQPTRPIPDAAL